MNLPVALRILLWPLSVVYGAIVRLRAGLYARGVFKAKRLKGAVISVGNLTVGGTGKTPMVIWLAEKFLARGKRVAILSRGYRGANGTSDEIELMKARLGERVAFGVGKDRFAEGHRIEAQGPVDIFLLDDGFQRLSLARDADVVLVDATRPLHKELLLPAGRRREPSSALGRADAVVFTRVEPQDSVRGAIDEFPQLPIFAATIRLLGYCRLAGDGKLAVVEQESLPEPVFVFCGIGNPEAFFADVERWGIKVSGRTSFRDHHAYGERDLKRLQDAAERAGAATLLTTEKDAQKLRDVRAISLPIYFCRIAMEMREENAFFGVLERKLSARGGAAA
jgi:tetraacyldisaccharide 4'-kinase